MRACYESQLNPTPLALIDRRIAVEDTPLCATEISILFGPRSVPAMAANIRNQSKWALFKCRACGRCCSELGLPYDPYRVSDISATLGITADELIHKYYGHPAGDGKHWVSDNEKRKPCPFLVPEGNRMTCRIYSVRPEACRAFPFDTDLGACGVDCPAAEVVALKLGTKGS